MSETKREPIEDYCIRASRVHPWALEAGSTIKALRHENTQLLERIKDLERLLNSLPYTKG